MKKWFLYKTICVEVILVLLSCNNGTTSTSSGGLNSSPYQVNGPFTAKDYAVGSGDQTFQLTIAEQNGLKDPDGDIVYFRSSTLPSWITLDESTGIVTVATVNSHTAETIQFWSEDEYGADSSASLIEIAVSVTQNNTPPTNKIFFASDRDGDFEIYSLNLDTDVLTKLTDNDVTDKQPSISADGTKIAFVSNSSGSWAIYTIDADGSNVSGALVTSLQSYDGHPSWNPDGTKFIYNLNYDIHVINSDGTGGGNITSTVFDDEKNAVWSHDGTKIAYTMKPDSGDYNIYIMNSDGSGALQLTTDAGIDQEPSWSADDSRIVFSTNRGGDYDIYTINTDGTLPSVLSGNTGDETSPSWSSDGTRIAYVKGGDIYIRNADGSGAETNITNDASTDQDPSW